MVSSLMIDSRATMNQKASISPELAKFKPWYSVILIVTATHLLGMYTVTYQALTTNTLRLVIATCVTGGLGITAGYHRLWSHNAYKASPPLQIVLALGSIKWWCLRHRLHHRYTDTAHDPYNAERGFWYSHMGWMFEKKEYTRLKWIDKSDLDSNPIVVWQHRYYIPLSILLAFVVPTVIGWGYNETLGAFLYGSFVSRVLLWHATWFINSLAHSWGSQEYSTENTSKGNIVLALLTMGEGHHNFHHEFPRDYRNGINFDDWDPTKWLIAACSFVGLAYSLIKVDESVILKSRVEAAQDRIKVWNSSLVWSDADVLPQWNWDDFKEECKSQDLIVLDDYACDVTDFKFTHPGGMELLRKFRGRDATKGFYGKLNIHTKSARQMMRDLRVAKLKVE